ncbi:tetratricopeptide repeat protein [Spongiibacter sp. KMU-166]|uniref:Tetratricopeptide repeat protein n=1 Tax=Spongiibacter thalassae TaxID=2721624 RepID=A0ABX1GH79_9GAMM|nr:cellulose synthase subunit BcsC-related outer membrane protein [Spongiibacter thalassae]NKI17842.1 tetratricopeptide repeat protein [Spongiibacter thalassae]
MKGGVLAWLALVLLLGLLVWRQFASGPDAELPEYDLDIREVAAPKKVLQPLIVRNTKVEMRYEQQIEREEVMNRVDLMKSALVRLQALNPNSPDVYFFQAWMAVEEGRMEEAEGILQTMQLEWPKATRTAQLEDYLRVKGEDKAQLQTARVLAKAGRPEQALVLFEKLFRDSPPLLSLQLEYLRLMGRVDARKDEALQRLEQLNEKYENFPPVQLALAEELASTEEGRPRAREIFADIANGPAYGLAAAQSWRRMLERQEINPEVLRDYEVLALRYPGDLAIQESYRGAIEAEQAERERMRNPYYRAKKEALAYMDRGLGYKARPKLLFALRGRPEDPELHGNLGILALRAGQHEAAVSYFNRALHYNVDPDKTSRWESLKTTASFWYELRRGEALRDDRRYVDARAALQRAGEIDPLAPEPFVVLGEIAWAQQDFNGAEAFYYEALRRDPYSEAALWGRVQMRYEKSGFNAAQALVNSYGPAERKAIASSWAGLKRDNAIQHLEKIRRSGSTAQIASAIDNVIAQEPLSAWQRSDVVEAMQQIGQAERADQYMERWASRDRSPEMQFAYALYLSKRGEELMAIAVLERIPESRRSDAMNNNLARLQLNAELNRTADIDNESEIEAIARLEERFAGQDGPLLRVANRWFDVGERERAATLLASLTPIAEQPMYRQLEMARLYLRLEDFEAFSAWYDEAIVDTSKLDAVELAELTAMSAEYDMARARQYEEEGRYVIAASMYQRAMKVPGQHQTTARLGVIRQQGNLGNAVEFRQQSEYLLTQSATLSNQQLLDFAALQADYQQRDLQFQALHTLAARPDVSDQLMRSAMLQSVDAERWDIAEEYAYAALQRAQGATVLRFSLSEKEKRNLYKSADRNYWLSSSVVANIQKMRERTDSYIKFGIDVNERRAGDSTAQIPVDLRLAIPSLDGHLRLRLDYVRIRSGDVDYLDPDGSVPPVITRIPFSEEPTGVALGIGWEADTWRADIGTTPLGFEKTGVVGGFRYDGDIGDAGWSLALSRRAETGTPLSYAGMTVPSNAATGAGQTWGGVLRTGAKLGFSYDLGGKYGYWSSLQYHQLTGDTVEDNTRIGVLGGVYRRVIAEDHRNLRIGLNLLHLQYDKNLEEYTLGHGAYYSPQNYLSLSIPVRYFGRGSDNWSYLIGGSVSRSWSSSDAPYKLGTGSSDGGGFGYYLEAAVERRISRRWYIGAAADIHRADFYEPNHISIYAKYHFQENWDAIVSPPEPPIPYSEFD